MDDELKMEKDMIASVHYTGTLKDGEEFDSSEGRDPLTFLVGHMQMIPGFEEEMMGAGVDESRTFTLTPERAYGMRDETGILEIPRDQFPEEMELEVGMTLVADMENGPAPFNILEVDDSIVKADFNHKLAGESLTFTVKIVELRKASEEELAHGHAHGPGGHHH
ncbi:MAG TPA: peptidylprolyl isomerase [Candidatus Poseidoniales archaeon]|jgi:FKBP-type peptidyl-prolyl cis-trans isomerase SlyD|nr:MAG: peptidylprolyl isomerase [Euryarchaeota archaeon]HIF16704.1 peptidylprolyl isomerase [Candidatus Poseidoniales archaeon]